MKYRALPRVLVIVVLVSWALPHGIGKSRMSAAKAKAKAKSKQKPRIRRAPEEARHHILDAADAVFARSLPDAVGLREVAEEAEISHGLITHYFATYENLVAEVIARRFAAARSLAGTQMSTIGGDEDQLLRILTDLMADKALMRLFTWALMTGHTAHLLNGRGLGSLIDAMEAELVRRKVPVTRDSLEMSVLLLFSTVIGWSIAGEALQKSANRAPMKTEQLRAELRHLVRGFLMVRR